MQTIKKLQDEGFTGVDVSLDISLFEYGIAWKVEGDEIKVYYGIDVNDQGDYTKFDWGSYAIDLDCKSEFDWVDWKSFLNCIGMTENDFHNMETGKKLFDLNGYYGSESVFGSSYTEGFEIAE